MTLTVKNGENLDERFNHLQKSLKTLLQRRRDCKRGKGYKSVWGDVAGLVGSYEITNKGNGWHPHAHIITLSNDYLSKAALADEWCRTTGDSFQVDAQPIRHPEDPAQDFVEVFKYAVKFSELSLYHNYVVFHVLSGRNLIYSAGLLRGVKIPKTLLDDPIKDEPYYELMYAYFKGEGYKQTPIKERKYAKKKT